MINFWSFLGARFTRKDTGLISMFFILNIILINTNKIKFAVCACVCVSEFRRWLAKSAARRSLKISVRIVQDRYWCLRHIFSNFVLMRFKGLSLCFKGLFEKLFNPFKKINYETSNSFFFSFYKPCIQTKRNMKNQLHQVKDHTSLFQTLPSI